ncbi:DUF2530 domain-containing protein [Bifidobacterium apri]|uniref:DUF2530 domain-containing protein n=1 Tax=Bifidobacterium apri TaxID=1769423 RepID=A0A6A2WFZ9_9BIFI|nr:DUF2530 domain-containing protein [Bifidobacterium apri]KAB8300804.1 hypothetical protein DSM100238_0531 [Bifidobacterium apri]
MKLAPIFDPAARRPSPKPVRVDLRKVFLIGTAAWTAALIVCAMLLALHVPALKELVVCVAGVLVGIILLVWEHFDRWDYRRLGK